MKSVIIVDWSESHIEVWANITTFVNSQKGKLKLSASYIRNAMSDKKVYYHELFTLKRYDVKR